MPFPWEKVILHSPQVLETARNLYGKWKSRPAPAEVDPKADVHTQIAVLLQRVEAIEEAGESQAEVTKALSEQNQGVFNGLSELKEQITQTSQAMRKVEEQKGADQQTIKYLADQVQVLSTENSKLSKRAAQATGISIVAVIIAAGALALQWLK